MDVFTAHMTRKVKEALSNCGTAIEYVPGGFTPKLQVMDVGINKPFKGAYRQQFEQFMVQSPTRKPCRQDVATWIDKAWQAITTATI